MLNVWLKVKITLFMNRPFTGLGRGNHEVGGGSKNVACTMDENMAVKLFRGKTFEYWVCLNVMHLSIA